VPAYTPRIADAELARRLEAHGAVLIEGPKASGKTETARRLAQSEVRLDVDDGARRAAQVDPTLILGDAPPLLIDEWQHVPAIWNHVRRAVDHRGAVGQFILTGSAVPPDDDTRHTGAGRISRMLMRPMSLAELGRSSAEVSLASLLSGEPPRAADTGLRIPDIAEDLARGGWPGFRGRSLEAALEAVRDYLAEVCRTDISRVDGVGRDPIRVEQLVASLARNVATYAATSTLAADAPTSGPPLKEHTAAAYLDSLARLMVVEDQPAWAPHLRSRYRLRRAAKRHFVDPSLAVAAMRAMPERLIADLNLFGFLFESLVVRDLRVYAQANDARVLQYRDSNGLEIDAIVEVGDGRWAAFEVKLGEGQIDEAATNLSNVVRQIDTTRCGEPACLGVIVPSGYGYMRSDGVAVIPIGTLGV
jgi:predicted AAA+ superfamily ATPase